MITEIGVSLFQRWSDNLPDEAKSEETMAALAQNASDATIFVVKEFIEKSSAATDRIKNAE